MSNIKGLLKRVVQVEKSRKVLNMKGFTVRTPDGSYYRVGSSTEPNGYFDADGNPIDTISKLPKG